MPPLGSGDVTIIDDEVAAQPATEVPTEPMVPYSPAPAPMLPDRQRFPEELTPSPATTALDQDEHPKSPDNVVQDLEGETVAEKAVKDVEGETVPENVEVAGGEMVTSPEKIPATTPTDVDKPTLETIEGTGQAPVSEVPGEEVFAVEVPPSQKDHHILDELERKILTRADQDRLQYPDGKPRGRPPRKEGKGGKGKGRGRGGRSKAKGKGKEDDQEGQTEKGRRGRSKAKGKGKEDDQEGQTEKGRRGRSKAKGKGKEDDQEGQTEKGRRGRSKVNGKGKEDDQEGQTEKGRRGRSKVKGKGKEEEKVEDPNPRKSKASRKDRVKKSLEADFEEAAKEDDQTTEEPKPKRTRKSWPARENLPQFQLSKLEPYYSRNAVGLKMNSGKGVSGVSQAWVSTMFPQHVQPMVAGRVGNLPV